MKIFLVLIIIARFTSVSEINWPTMYSVIHRSCSRRTSTITTVLTEVVVDDQTRRTTPYLGIIRLGLHDPPRVVISLDFAWTLGTALIIVPPWSRTVGSANNTIWHSNFIIRAFMAAARPYIQIFTFSADISITSITTETYYQNNTKQKHFKKKFEEILEKNFADELEIFADETRILADQRIQLLFTAKYMRIFAFSDSEPYTVFRIIRSGFTLLIDIS